MKIAVITYPVPTNIRQLFQRDDYEKVIVVDRAYDEVVKKELDFDLLIGDFDSTISFDEKYEVIRLPKEKNVTDTYKAVEFADEYLPDEIILFGGLSGNRVDHLIANLNLLQNFDDLTIINEFNTIKKHAVGNYIINKTHTYLSFYALTPALISIKGVSYQLTDYQLQLFDSLNTSNKIIKKSAQLEVKSGVIISIQSSD